MDSEIITLLAAGCCGAAFGLLAYFVLLALTRIESVGEMSEDTRRAFPVLFRLVWLVWPLRAIVHPVAAGGGCAAMRAAVEPKLGMAGYGDAITATDFVGLKLLFYVIAFLVALLGMAAGNPLVSLVMAVMLAVYPGVWLTTRIQKRHLSILKALPNVLDLLTLSVEAGKDFMTSLQDILKRRKLDPLGEELMRTFQEVQLGRKRADALRDMAKRVRQPDLTAVLNAVVQAEELGVSIGQLLRIQGDMLRGKRFTLAEKLANEAPVKIIPAIVLFIFPAVLLILIVPIGMKVAQVLN